MKVVIFSNIPAPYFVEYLNELGKYISVLAIFERRGASNRDKTWKKINNKRFEYEILNGINCGMENSFSLKIISIIKKYNRDSILIFANPMTPSGIVGISYCILKKIPYVIQSEGGFAKKGIGIKEQLKKIIIRKAHLCLSGMKSKNDYFLMYGADPKKVKWYPFASLYSSDFSEEIYEEDKIQIKKYLSISYDKVILYVGQVIHRKGIDVLIRACKKLDSKVGIYIVGGEENKEYRKLSEKLNVNNIHYIQHLNLETLKQYYRVADIFVLPTREDTWGLVVNEAMSFKIPVITTYNCVAGIELIKDRVNGFLVKSEDYTELHKKIKLLIENPLLCKQIGNNNFYKIKEYTYENMAYKIFDHLTNCLIMK